jgi:heme/copper-type cytochrome/quinol oxidase subunit 2
VLAGFVATGWRWAPLVAALVCIVGLVPEVVVLPGHFDDPAPGFILNVLLTPSLFLVAILAGIGATVHNYRRAADPRAPRWLPTALWILGGVIVGGSLVAARPQNDARMLSTAELAALPTVTTRAFAFDQPEIQAKVGEPVALRLHNEDSVAHRFDLDAFNVHVSMFRDEESVAVFVPTQAGSYTFHCHLPGHEAMQGTVIVQP